MPLNLLFQEHRESIKLSVEECSMKKPDDMTAFNEDWNLSQFWYDDQTSEILAKACVQGAGLTGHIACISAPTAYVAIKKHFPEAKGNPFFHFFSLGPSILKDISDGKR